VWKEFDNKCVFIHKEQVRKPGAVRSYNRFSRYGKRELLCERKILEIHRHKPELVN
jgi:hypothetical protein